MAISRLQELWVSDQLNISHNTYDINCHFWRHSISYWIPIHGCIHYQFSLLKNHLIVDNVISFLSRQYDVFWNLFSLKGSDSISVSQTLTLKHNIHKRGKENQFWKVFSESMKGGRKVNSTTWKKGTTSF